jgi:hypothetical protein
VNLVEKIIVFQIANTEVIMNPIVKLTCEPNALGQKLEELCNNLEGHKKIAIAQQGSQREPAALEFRKVGVLENIGRSLHIVFFKGAKERAATIQSVIARNLIQVEHLWQAIANIDRGATQVYERFFKLHIFRKGCKDYLQWLPQIYLKLWQSKGTFEPVLRSMKPHLQKLREITKLGIVMGNVADLPDIVFKSNDGQDVYAHSKWLSGIAATRNAPVQWLSPLQFNWNASAKEIHLFLDIVYGARALEELSNDDLLSVYELANFQAYNGLGNAASLLMYERGVSSSPDACDLHMDGPPGE